LDHVVVLNRRHLTGLLKKYFVYYHRYRTHLAVAKDVPEPRAVMNPGRIIAIPQMGGLHHHYERVAA
jgi:putative transposase